MQFKSTITTLTYLASAAQAITWNDQLKVYDVGLVPNEPGHINATVPYLDISCGGIPQGGYVCGSFHSEGVVALRAIYICVNGRFMRNELCAENTDHNRCVKNSRRPHHKFYPAVDGEKIVCRRQRDVENP